MGMIGRYIDSLGDAARDRIIEHPDPTFGGAEWRSLDANDGHFGCACLIGAAENAPACSWEVARDDVTFDHWWRDHMSPWLCALSARSERVGRRFPLLADRFGAPRAWAVCKARAAKRNRIPESATQCERVGAAHGE